MKQVTYLKAWELLDAGARLGTLPSFAYVLGSHVIAELQARNAWSGYVALPSLYARVLRCAKTGRYLAGQIDQLVHQGIGTRIGDSPLQISPHYIDALQKLHRSGVLRNDLRETASRAPENVDTHFTMDPRLREGKKWNEDTPVFYCLPTGDLRSTVQMFADAFDPCIGYEDMLVEFRG